MMTLDECIAAARLPISVIATPTGNIKMRCKCVFGGREFVYGDASFATIRYKQIRTRLSEQQGEKR